MKLGESLKLQQSFKLQQAFSKIPNFGGDKEKLNEVGLLGESCFPYLGRKAVYSVLHSSKSNPAIPCVSHTHNKS
jgi:hypothetical protein